MQTRRLFQRKLLLRSTQSRNTAWLLRFHRRERLAWTGAYRLEPQSAAED